MSTPALKMSLFRVGTEENLLPLISLLVGAAVFAAESRKHAANNAKCQELGWSCIPLAIEAYSNWGERGVLPPSLSACYQPGQLQIQNESTAIAFILSEISG